MKRNAMASTFALTCLVGLLCSGASARAEVSVHIDIGNAPPPPRFVFVSRPHEVYVPEQRVYVVDDSRLGDDDCFRYGGYYWVFRSGYWYRTSRWGGRFVVVEPRYVPTVFYQVPARRWKHHPGGPPAHARSWDPPGHSKAYKGDKDNHGRGGGHGKK